MAVHERPPVVARPAVVEPPKGGRTLRQCRNERRFLTLARVLSYGVLGCTAPMVPPPVHDPIDADYEALVRSGTTR